MVLEQQENLTVNPNYFNTASSNARGGLDAMKQVNMADAAMSTHYNQLSATMQNSTVRIVKMA